MNLQPVYIVGPTASGKSALAMRLAKELDGVIISADSMQIYRRLNIGTAKDSYDERREVEHQMIDIRDPDEEFSVAEYAELASACISNALERGKSPIIVGGTGLYFDALLYPMSFGGAKKDEQVRGYLEKIAAALGPEGLHDLLAELDSEAAARLHANDVKRVIRALEVVITTGKTMAENADVREDPDVIIVGLNTEREALYEKINARVDAMFEQGLVDEALSVGSFEYQSMQAIGYKEFAGCNYSVMDGKYVVPDEELEVIKDKIKQHTRNYAKRQLTWFKKYSFVKWFDCADGDGAIEYIKQQLEK